MTTQQTSITEAIACAVAEVTRETLQTMAVDRAEKRHKR